MSSSLLKENIDLESKGLISRHQIKAEIKANEAAGIRFSVNGSELVPANVDSISSTQRNTVLSNGVNTICLTEHFMAGAALINLNHVDVDLSDEELPFGDGSSKLWLDLFKEKNLVPGEAFNSSLSLKEEIKIVDPEKPHRYIIAKPSDENFKATYLMDWNHPKIGKQSFTWQLGVNPIEDITDARTFSTEMENQMLGLSGWIVGITEDDFTMPLRFADEPSRHKVLDLIGDLYLSGINPLLIKMEIISNQGGHHLNSLLAKAIREQNI